MTHRAETKDDLQLPNFGLNLVTLRPAYLRRPGSSRQKGRAMIELALGGSPRKVGLAELPDEEAMECFCALRGVGAGQAESFLLSARDGYLCKCMKITLYRKAGCPWSAAIMGLLNELNIPYEIKNVTSNPAYAEELKAASGQCMSPSIDVDGTMLADASVEDLAKVLEQRGLII